MHWPSIKWGGVDPCQKQFQLVFLWLGSIKYIYGNLRFQVTDKSDKVLKYEEVAHKMMHSYVDVCDDHLSQHGERHGRAI